MTTTRTRKASPTRTPNREPLLLKRIEGLEAEVIILRNALSDMEEERTGLLKKIEELNKAGEETVAKEDYDSLFEDYGRLEKLYITARALVNIPESVEGMLFELLKSRLLVWDKITYLGGGLLDANGTHPADAVKFDWFTELLPPVKESRQKTAE
ncbi:MAG: hypothetical protein K6E55_10785 [Thermoguttaceae bacterium]|nr:hypothetical protein [Thermoguttaceae bacterium]